MNSTPLTRRLFVNATAAVLLIAAAGHADAAIINLIASRSSDSTGSLEFVNGVFNETMNPSADRLVTSSFAGNPSNNGANAGRNVFGEARVGRLRSISSVDTNGGTGGPATFEAVNTSYWWSSFTISAPGRAGQRGRFNGSIAVDGELAAQAGLGAFAKAAIELFLRGGGGFNEGNVVMALPVGWRLGTTSNSPFGGGGSRIFIELESTPPNTGRSIPPTVLPFAFDFTFGQEAAINVGLRTYARIHTGQAQAALASSDFTSTLAWNGISSVTALEDGAEVAAYSITAPSGFDFARPFQASTSVPAPTTFGLLAAALLAGVSRARACNRRPERVTG